MGTNTSNSHEQPRVLILGGTTQGRELAAQLARQQDSTVWYALAGRTQKPRVDGIPPKSILVGNLGGANGLTRFLREHRVHALIDATHPFAQKISRNACDASARASVPIARFERTPWIQGQNDNWHYVASTEAAIAFLLQPHFALRYRKVLLTIGAAELPAWCNALGVGAHACVWRAPKVIARSIEAPLCELPSNFTNVRARGPFSVADESQLITDQRVELIVSKLSGGSTGYSKVLAARQRCVPMLMLTPPALPAAQSFSTVAQMIRWVTEAAGRSKHAT